MARLPSLRALFARATSSAPVPAAEITADRHAAATELLEAQRGVEAAQVAYDAGLLDPAADRRALDDARRDAGLRLDAAKALAIAFADKAVAAQAAERRVELNRVIAEADRAQATFEELARNDLPAVGIALPHRRRGTDGRACAAGRPRAGPRSRRRHSVQAEAADAGPKLACTPPRAEREVGASAGRQIRLFWRHGRG